MTAFEMYATGEISQSAQEYIQNQIQSDIDRITYDISSAMDDLFGNIIHTYYNEPELYEQNIQAFKEIEEKVLNFREKIKEYTEIYDIKKALNDRRRRGSFVASLVGGAL